MIRNMACSLIRTLDQHEDDPARAKVPGRIVTTLPKAKELRPYAERLITLAKRGDLHARRLAARRIQDHEVLRQLFGDIGPKYSERPGGYTRILKLGPRRGDSADMSLIELVD